MKNLGASPEVSSLDRKLRTFGPTDFRSDSTLPREPVSGFLGPYPDPKKRNQNRRTREGAAVGRLGVPVEFASVSRHYKAVI
jgi:hypothetical protein